MAYYSPTTGYTKSTYIPTESATIAIKMTPYSIGIWHVKKPISYGRGHENTSPVTYA
jgi:hypothetical protein